MARKAAPRRPIEEAAPHAATPEDLRSWVERANRLMRQSGVLVAEEDGGLRLDMATSVPGWRVSCLMVEQGGQHLIADLRVFPGPTVRSGPRRKPDGSLVKLGEWDGKDVVPEPGVTTRLLRHISVAELAEHARAYVYEVTEGMDPGASMRLSPSLRQVATRLAEAGTVKRTGRKGTPDAQYLPYAQMYHQAVVQRSRRPVADVHEALFAAQGWPNSRGVVRDLIHQCRIRGLLSDDGRLTPKALELAQPKDKGGKQ